MRVYRAHWTEAVVCSVTTVRNKCVFYNIMTPKHKRKQIMLASSAGVSVGRCLAALNIKELQNQSIKQSPISLLTPKHGMKGSALEILPKALVALNVHRWR